MKFIHLSDMHLLAHDDVSRQPDASATLRKIINEINLHHRDAEICVITGDITHHGRPDQYENAARLLSELQIPYTLIPGNHDDRTAFKKAFPDIPVDANGFINHAATYGDIRFVLLDSTVPGALHGTLCEKRLSWLRDELAVHKNAPTFLFIHHPPMEMGLPFMDTIRLDADRELAEIIADNPQIKHMFFGHLHRPAAGTWQGIPVLLGASTQCGLPLDLGPPKDEDQPDRPPLQPGYGIAFADPDGSLRYHFDFIEFDL